MTPEERARLVAQSLEADSTSYPDPDNYRERNVERIAAAIREAVEAEKEACAAMVDSAAEQRLTSKVSKHPISESEVLKIVAAAIRARRGP